MAEKWQHGNMSGFFLNDRESFCHCLPCSQCTWCNLLLSLPLQVMNGAILQQVFVVEFVIQYQMCDDCHRVEAKDFWKAVVQVRQKVGVCGLMTYPINKKVFSEWLSTVLLYLNSTYIVNLLKIYFSKHFACMLYA